MKHESGSYQNMAEQLLETTNNAWLRLIWFCHGKITRHYTTGDCENHMSLTVWSTALPHPLEDPSISWPITGRLNSCVIKMEPQWAENEVNWSLTGIKWASHWLKHFEEASDFATTADKRFSLGSSDTQLGKVAEMYFYSLSNCSHSTTESVCISDQVCFSRNC